MKNEIQYTTENPAIDESRAMLKIVIGFAIFLVVLSFL